MIYDNYAGRIATLHGTTVTVTTHVEGYTPAKTDADLDSIDTFEVDAGDAPGYSRQTVDVTWDEDTRRLTFDDPIEFDLDGADDVRRHVIADASGDLAFVLSFDTPFDGYDGYVLDPPIAASEADVAGLDARVLALEAAPAPGSPVPDPTAAPDGKIVTVFDGAYVLEDAPSGGSVPDPAGGTDGQVPTIDGGVYVLATPSGGGGAAGIVEVDLSAETGSWVECDLSELAATVATVRVEPPTDVDATIEFSWPDMLTRPPLVIIIGGSPVKVGVYVPPIPQVNQPKTLLVTPSSESGGRHGVWLDPIWWDGVSASEGQTLEIVNGAPAWVTP